MEERSNSNSSRQDQERHVSFDASRDMHSPRFRAVMRATSGKKRHSIKSFSHEMNSKGAQRYLHRKARGLNFSQVKFTRLKEDVNCELKVFAGELIELLEMTLDSHPEWRTTIEDLLVTARETAEMSPDEFRKNCEAIVQNLDDSRLTLPSGTLKKLYTRMLFILTRCTRMLQFQNEGEADHVLNFHQRSDLGVYSASGEAAISDHCTNIRPVNVGKPSLEKPALDGIHNNLERDSAISSDSPGSRERISSWKKLPSAAEKNLKKDSDEFVSLPSKDMPDFLSSLDKVEKNSTEQTGAQIVVPKKPEDLSSDDDSVMICRICDLKIPKLYVEEHSRICAIADRCDCKGLSVDERLERVAEILEKILEACTPKQSDTNAKILEAAGEISEEYEELSSDRSITLHPSLTDEMKHLPVVISSLRMIELNVLPPMWCNTQCATTPEPGTKASSIGSMTPLSRLATPRAYQVDSLLLGPSTFPELENFQQMHDLLDIVHCILNIKSRDYRSLDDLHSCLHDLQEVVNEKKVDALIVETFSTRIEKLLQEKYTLILLQIDEGKVDHSRKLDDEDDLKKSNNVHGTQTSAICSKFKDRTTIEDFEIIKPISRGAFGRVFLAKKRITGDLFAIKVLKKTDMIRKNAVESILAERDILISVRNPFVVRFYYSFTCSENLYLVMEYLNGGDLYSLLRSLGCLEEDMARTYIAEIILALEYLHSLNVIHRDLKPDNLLIGHDGHIKLTDFGLSKVGLINSTDDLSGPDSSSLVMLTNCEQEVSKELRMQKREQRQRQCVVGTPDYLAPEILLGMPHGRSVDWWSVGIILFELLVGIPPFNAEHPQKIFDNIMNRDIPWPLVPEEMSFEAYDLINKLLIENPMQRLGATGSSEVKCHPFFSNINWDMLAQQKAAFIPSTEGENDTSYFICRHQWASADAQLNATFNDSESMSDTCSLSSCSTPCGYEQDEEGDKCCKLAEFESSNFSVNYSFSNFSFKNLSRLASINYDLLKKDNSEEIPSNPQPS